MIGTETVLAVIPARGGSKRCPMKNIRDFRGKPLILWSIEAAKKSRYIDYLLVSSENAEILGVVGDAAQKVKRPDELATDDATNEDVLRHALTLINCNWVVLLQPTSPLRTAEDIDACIERAQMGDGCITYSKGTWEKNGAVYVARRKWLENHDFHHAGLMKLYMPDERSLDINYAEEFA